VTTLKFLSKFIYKLKMPQSQIATYNQVFEKNKTKIFDFMSSLTLIILFITTLLTASGLYWIAQIINAIANGDKEIIISITYFDALK